MLGVVVAGIVFVALATTLGLPGGGGPGAEPSDGVRTGMRAAPAQRPPTPAEAVTYGGEVEGEPGAMVRGAPAVKSLRCESPSLLRIETGAEAIVATITVAGSWDCGAALGQWAATTPSDANVGVEVAETRPGGQGSIILLNDRGASLNISVAQIRRET